MKNITVEVDYVDMSRRMAWGRVGSLYLGFRIPPTFLRRVASGDVVECCDRGYGDISLVGLATCDGVEL